MSSNIKIERICEWCGNRFMAQTTVTRFCSKRCAAHSYKERMRQQKIQLANSTVPATTSAIKEKDYLTVAETAQVLGMTRQGIYKLIYLGNLVAAFAEIGHTFYDSVLHGDGGVRFMDSTEVSLGYKFTIRAG